MVEDVPLGVTSFSFAFPQLICTGAKPIHPVHGRQSCEPWGQCSEIEITFLPFSRVFLVFGLSWFSKLRISSFVDIKNNTTSYTFSVFVKKMGDG